MRSRLSFISFLFVAFLAGFLGSVSTACALSFGAPVSFSTGTYPQELAIADLNGDGRPDVVTTNVTGNTVSVLLGDGLGGFATKTDYPTDSGPWGIAIGDLNRDGKPDLVTANAYTNTISVMLGNGGGGFTGRTDIIVGNGPRSVVLADFNRDGILDLAVLNAGSGTYENTVSILLGDGIGGFVHHVDYVGLVQPLGIAAGDLNNDGKCDLVIANYDNNSIAVLLGNGDGTFAAMSTYATDTSPQRPVIVDLNGDGIPDIVTANRVASSVSVLIGNGDGTFRAHKDLATGGWAQAVAVGDLNGDGKLDLAVSDITTGNVTVLINDGTGLFAPEFDFPGGQQGIALADLNGDGLPDVVSAVGSGNVISVELNTTCVYHPNFPFNLTGAPSVSQPSTGAGPVALAIGDLNGDGVPDLAVANQTASTISIIRGDGLGGFLGAVDFGVASGPSALAVADLNQDGRPDLVSANSGSGSVSVLLGQGAAQFGAHNELATGGVPMAVAIADLNRDGRPDVVVASQSPNWIRAWLGNGDGTFGALSYTLTTASSPGSITIVDVNRDAIPDLVVAYPTANAITVALGNGSGGFGTPVSYTTGPGPQQIAAGDFDRDGRTDLAVCNSGDGSVSIFMNNGSGYATPASIAGALGTPIGITAGDFNADGRLDLAVASSTPDANSATVAVLFGDGAGGFSTVGPPGNLIVGTGLRAIVAGDLDRDGKQDLVALDPNGGTAPVIFNESGFPSQATSAIGQNLLLVGATGGVIDGAGTKTMTIRNACGDPLVGDRVQIRFANCAEVTLASQQLWPGITAACSPPIVSGRTDATGQLTMDVMGGGNRAGALASGGCATAWSFGGGRWWVLGTLSVGALDETNTDGLDLSDLEDFTADLIATNNALSTQYTRSDFNGDGHVDALDRQKIYNSYIKGYAKDTGLRCDGAPISTGGATTSIGGLQMKWSRCDGPLAKTMNPMDCTVDQSFGKLVPSFTLPVGVPAIVAVAYDLDIVGDAGQPLPPWWQFDPVGCPASSFSLGNSGITATCQPLGGGSNIQFMTYEYPYPGTGAVDRGLLHVICTAMSTTALTSGARYALPAIVFANDNSGGPCTGCDANIAIHLNNLTILPAAVGGGPVPAFAAASNRDSEAPVGRMAASARATATSDASGLIVFHPGPGDSVTTFMNGVPAGYSITGIDHSQERVTRLAMRLLSENPSRGVVALEIRVPRTTRGTLCVSDIAGRRVREVRDDAWTAGIHMLSWDGVDEAGRRVSSGMYFIRLKTTDGSVTQSVLMLR